MSFFYKPYPSFSIIPYKLFEIEDRFASGKDVFDGMLNHETRKDLIVILLQI